MADTSREGFVTVRGRKIWFRMDGSGKNRIPLLILHGGPGLPHDYLLPLETLASDRPVIWYDQLGCGNSDAPGDISLYTLEYYTEELGIIREQLDLDEVHILGQSWGTMLAVDYILTRNPSGVRSLILSAPCLSASRWHADQRQNIEALPAATRDVIYQCEEGGLYDTPEYQEAVMIFYRRHVCRLDPWPECLERSCERIASDVYGLMWGPSEFTITGTLKTYERAADLRKIQIPTLFTCGRYDEASPDSTRYYHEMLPGSRIVLFEDASHSHHLEQEEAYIHAVREFLDN